MNTILVVVTFGAGNWLTSAGPSLTDGLLFISTNISSWCVAGGLVCVPVAMQGNVLLTLSLAAPNYRPSQSCF